MSTLLLEGGVRLDGQDITGLRMHERAKGIDFKEVYGKDHADSFLLLESGRAAAANVQANPRVVVYYRNTTKSERLPRGAVWRFFGKARVVASGPERDAVWAKVVPAEQEKDPNRAGAAVIVEVTKVTDLAKVIQE